MQTLILAATVVIGLSIFPALVSGADFGHNNPFFAPSTLPFQAPPFDKIKDEDYQPAIEAGMAEQLKEIQSIANSPAPPTFENTILAMEKSGQLLRRAQGAFFAVVSANSNPTLLKVRSTEAPSSLRTGTRSSSTQSSSSGFPPSTSNATPSGLIPNHCAWWSMTMTSSCTPEPNSATPIRLN